MSANSSLLVSSLDFSTIKENLITFMRAQAQFKDYDFEGSNIAVLMDLLAYNTYLNNFYTNMAISESFLDSAQLRDSVVSRAKELNYTPRSFRSSTAAVTIQFTPGDSPASITIPKGTSFNARLDSDVYSFVTDSDIVVSSFNDYSTTLDIYEGYYVTEIFQVDTSIDNQRFVLNNINIDTDSLSVVVQTSNSDTTNSEFIRATTLLGQDETSKIFFVQAADKERYEVVFGDGVIGVPIINGNIIKASYRAAKGESPNGCTDFKPSSSIAGYSTSLITVETITDAYGGAEPETVESIKFNAPRHYQTQDRAVTASDYRTIILEKFPDVRAINVYGGESVYPPDYGKVYISVDLNNFTGVPDIVKSDIISFLEDKMPISIEPKIVDADYLYLDVNANISYNLNLTTKNSTDIESVVTNAITEFDNLYLDKFKTTFRYSKLASAIDSSDTSIVSTNLTVAMIRKISPLIGIQQSISVDFQNTIKPYSVISSSFTYENVSAYLVDYELNEISIATKESGVETILTHNIGTVDYETGDIVLDLPAISAYTNSEIKIYATCGQNDISVINNTIIMIDPDDIEIYTTAIRE